MRKAYSHFVSADIKTLGLKVVRRQLFETVQNIYPSDWLLTTLKINQQVPIETEKAKSELLITPILNELRVINPKKFTYFSGYQFNVDEKRGLKGFCDFLISTKFDAAFIESPLVAVVEAKHNQDLTDATPQCIAEMYASQIFNEREGEPQATIFGNVTNGYEWLFLKLEDKLVTIDTERFSLTDLPSLLGTWQVIIDSFSVSD